LKGIRTEKLAEEIRQAISGVLQQKVSDPRLGMVGVTRVEVSNDLGHALAYISVLGDDAAQEASLKVLDRAQGFIRTELARSLRLRRVPELRFKADPGIRYSIRLQEVLRELGMDHPVAPTPDEDDPDA